MNYWYSVISLHYEVEQMNKVKNKETLVKDAPWRNLLLEVVEVAFCSINPYTLVTNKMTSDLKSKLQ